MFFNWMRLHLLAVTYLENSIDFLLQIHYSVCVNNILTLGCHVHIKTKEYYHAFNCFCTDKVMILHRFMNVR